jgi:hypothetical protein
MSDALEAACRPEPISGTDFNPHAQIPYGCTWEHIRLAMVEFSEFLGFVNLQLHSRDIARLEVMLMPANFSSMVGEFMGSSIPKYCSSLSKNQHHNGHPDLVPTDLFPGNAAQYASQGIEIKASRYLQGWQGHNPEETWLMVFAFDSNRPADAAKHIPPRPFRFLIVAVQP